MAKEVTIDSVLRSSDNDSKLCRDMLSYYTDVIKTDNERKNDDFVFTELGKWLLDHHMLFINEFAGSTIPKSYRLHSKRSYIQSRINELTELNIVKEKGTIRSEKNSAVDTPVYGFTLLGSILAWLHKARNNKGEERAMAIDKVFEILLYSIYKIDSYSIDLFTAFLKKCMNRGISKLFGDDNKILTALILSSLDFMESLYHNAPTASIHDPIRFFRVLFSIVSSIYKGSQQMLIETIKELENETQKIIMLQLKLDIESAYHGHQVLTKTWEQMRYKNMNDHEKVTIQGQCEVCEAQYPFEISIIEFMKIPYLYVVFQGKTIHDLEKMIQKLKCKSCGKQDSVFPVFPRWQIFEEGCYDIFSDEQKDYGV